jgi:hypothetical protein
VLVKLNTATPCMPKQLCQLRFTPFQPLTSQVVTVQLY